MDEHQSLNHSKWECKYHVVFIPKCRRKTLYGQLRRYLGEVFRKLAEQKESRIEGFWCNLNCRSAPQDSPHFHNGPSNAWNTGCRSMSSAYFSISGLSFHSSMVGISS